MYLPSWKDLRSPPIAFDKHSFIITAKKTSRISILKTGEMIFKWKLTIGDGVVARGVVENSNLWLASVRGLIFKISGIDGTIIWKMTYDTPVFNPVKLWENCILLTSVKGYILRLSKGSES